MSSSDIAVSVRGLGKSYTIAHKAADAPNTLAESVLQRLRHPLRRTPKETFWALKDVDFDIKAGEVVGIVGRNGAGKSTLLKILSRITEPTSGTVDLLGRVGSLLEVGTGFHPELTGRENVFLNGAILGMSRAEIKGQFDAIVDFAGVEKFLDTPVKRYSSGMYVRLAFAVAAHLQSEILIIDEVLAVGDVTFQKRCLDKMGEVAVGGRTVLFVSHNIAAITELCSRTILLRSGTLFRQGLTADVINEYLRTGVRQPAVLNLSRVSRPSHLRNIARVSSIQMQSKTEADWVVEFGSPLKLTMQVDVSQPLDNAEIGVSIFTAAGQELTSNLSSHDLGELSFSNGVHEISVSIGPVKILPGFYRIGIGIRSKQGMEDLLTDVAEFEIIPNDESMRLKTTTMNAVFVADASFALR